MLNDFLRGDGGGDEEGSAGGPPALIFYVLVLFSSLFRNKMVKIRKLENHLTR